MITMIPCDFTVYGSMDLSTPWRRNMKTNKHKINNLWTLLN